MNSCIPGLICRWYRQLLIPEMSGAIEVKNFATWSSRAVFSLDIEGGMGALSERILSMLTDKGKGWCWESRLDALLC
jgi:hypothetical protein